jgi:hypothetical protein
MTLGRYQFQISANTVRRRLAEHDLRPRIPARGPHLTAAHRRVRLLFAQNHVDWELDQWRLVMFSDESRFCLDQSDRRVRVNRCSGERYAICNIIPKVNFERFCYGLSRCHFRRSHRVGGARKRKPKSGDVHYQYSGTSYCPIPTIYWGDFIFMHDNGRPYVAGIVQHYFREVEIGQMQWPARSSDLNLIE